MSAAEPPADQRAQRLAKVEALRARGVDPYPVRFDRTLTVAEMRDRYDAQLEAGQELDAPERVAGRLMLIRRQGKLTFATMRDGTGSIQLFVSDDGLGEAGHNEFDQLDLGDWVGVEGAPMKTKRGELSVKVTAFTLLSKALRPLPDKWHGLTDIEARSRQRYLDLIVNDRSIDLARARSRVIAELRAQFVARGFIEVETPVLLLEATGANAKDGGPAQP